MNSSRRSNARSVIAFTIAVALLSAMVLTRSVDPRLRTMNHSTAAGDVINAYHPVKIHPVAMCACWQGPRGQMQKKVKFRIYNGTEAEWIDLAGGPDGSVYLYVAYPKEFEPILTMPSPASTDRDVITGPYSSPPNAEVTLTTNTVSVTPDRVDSVVAEQLGLEQNWDVWAIPANPDRLAELQDAETMTFPTWVDDQWLRPGDEYLGEGNGIGAWVFYLPAPPGIEWLPSSPYGLMGILSNSYLDSYYQVLGVGVRDRQGMTIGFGPVPPESARSHAGDF